MDSNQSAWNVEIWQGSPSAPHRWLIRDAEPPRHWYGALEDGQGGWRFERLSDRQLPSASEHFGEPADGSACDAVLQAFRDQVLGAT